MKTRIYYPKAIVLNEALELPKEQSHHIANVLRMKAGDGLIVFNGQGGEFECNIEAIQKNTVMLTVKDYLSIDRESPLPIILVQGISRGERMDYTIQKATELGVNEIQPMFTEFCTVKLPPDRAEKKIAHWQAIAISAAEQSGRTKPPTIRNPLPFHKILGSQGTLLIGNPETQAKIKTLSLKAHPIHLLIGPEGGFSDKEISAAQKAGATEINLGPRILRTETAGLVALSLLQTHFGDL